MFFFIFVFISMFLSPVNFASASVRSTAICPINLAKSSSFVKTALKKSSFKKYVQSLPKSKFDESKRAILPKWTYAFLRQIQAQVFGTFQPLSIVGVKNHDNASFNANARLVEFGIPFFKDVQSYPKMRSKTSVAEFIIAHEVGHLILDYSVHLSPSKDRTLNDFPIDGEEDAIPEFEKIQKEMAEGQISETEARTRRLAIFQRLSCPHVEVDLFGYLILKQVRKSFPEDNLLFFLNEQSKLDIATEAGEVFYSDLEARKSLYFNLKQQLIK